MASNTCVEEVKIPVIDLSAPNAAEALLDAAIRYGFVFVKHDTVIDFTPEDVDRMFDLGRSVFALPEDIKRQYKYDRTATGSNYGYVGMHMELLDAERQQKGDFKEAWNIGQFVSNKAQQPLPELLRMHETHIAKFTAGCHALCNRILKLFAIALKISEREGGAEWFSARHDQTKASGTVFRLLHYPALPRSAATISSGDIRAGAHSDYGSLTLLFRLPGQPGLELLTPAGEWASVPINPEFTISSNTPPILVNIGDLLSYWTNGLLRSTVHRVIFPTEGDNFERWEDRYSIAYFCHANDDVNLVEVPSDIVRAYGRARKTGSGLHSGALTAKEHLNHRLAGSML